MLKKNALLDDGSKKQKHMSSHAEEAKGNNQEGREKEAALVRVSDGRGPN